MVTKTFLNPVHVDDVPEVTPKEVSSVVANVALIDVRTPQEFTGELGHIPGAKLIPLGPELETYLKSADKNQEIVFICRSGARSAYVTQFTRSIGFTHTANLQGGMMLWNAQALPVER